MMTIVIKVSQIRKEEFSEQGTGKTPLTGFYPDLGILERNHR